MKCPLCKENLLSFIKEGPMNWRCYKDTCGKFYVELNSWEARHDEDYKNVVKWVMYYNILPMRYKLIVHRNEGITLFKMMYKYILSGQHYYDYETLAEIKDCYMEPDALAQIEEMIGTIELFA